MNPFQYGSVVRGEAFCNRKTEIRDLRRAMENAGRLFVHSERRLGKTSLVRHVLDRLPRTRHIGAYVDLWPTDSESTFAVAMARALVEAHATTSKKLLEAARSLFTALVPSVTLDDAGKPKLSFDLTARSRPTRELDEVLEAPAVLAKRTGRRVTVVLDECQRLLEYGSDLVERRLRSVIQHQSDVAYVFLGSRKHLIQGMFLDSSRPLYRSAGHYPLRAIETRHWIPFVRVRFQDAGRGIDEDLVREVCRLTQGHPFYTQHLCHVLWELCPEGGSVDADLVQEAVRVLLDRESFAYSTLWESLLVNHRRLLTGLAHEPEDVKPFSSAFTRRYGLRSASNAQRAVKALVERDVIEKDESSYVVVDRFFRLWIRQVSGRTAG
jgi:hypothetical protein